MAGTDILGTWLSSSAKLQPHKTTTDGDGRYTPTSIPIARWGIYWFTPTSIVFLFLLSVGTAIAHHEFYTKLDNTSAGEADYQQSVIRIGTGLTILFRAALVAMVGISRKQWLWVTLRKRFITLKGINAMFGATTDPSYFGNADMLLSARLATIMALVMWVIPLTAVLTLDTITVKPASDISHTAPCNAPTVKFDFDINSTATRNPMNYTSLRPVAHRYRGVYQGPSAYTRNLFTVAAFDGFIPREPITFPGCPEHAAWCDYNTTVVLPSVNCTQEDYPEVAAADWETPALWRSLFDDMIPDDKIPVFVAQRDRDNRNTIWIAHVNRDYRTETLYPSLVSCRNSITRYQLGSTAPQESSLKNDTFIAWLNTDEEHLLFVEDVTASALTSASEYDGSFAFFDMLIEILTGSILRDRDPSPFGFEDFANTTTTNLTRIESTNAVTSTNLFAMETTDLLGELSMMAINMGAALILRPDHEFSAVIATTCLIWENNYVYVYAPRKLLITYGTAVTVGFVMACVGFAALAINGVASDASFSTILLTTRNRSLDQLTAGGCIGGAPLPEELGKLRMKFGEVATATGEEGVGHMAIGVEGEVTRIRKRGRYS